MTGAPPPPDAPGAGTEPADWELEAVTVDASSTRELAAALARTCRAGDVLLLVGGLGAGKTTFAQGFARALGVVGPVTSPTFTLVRQYPCTGAGVPGVAYLVHADVYRLDSAEEMADLGLHELGDDAVTLVEWGDRAAPVLASSTLTVELEPVVAGTTPEATVPGSEPTHAAPAGTGRRATAADDGEPRRITLAGRGAAWAGRRPAVAAALAPYAVLPGEGGDPGSPAGRAVATRP